MCLTLMQSLQKFQYQSAFLELHMSLYNISMSVVLEGASTSEHLKIKM